LGTFLNSRLVRPMILIALAVIGCLVLAGDQPGGSVPVPTLPKLAGVVYLAPADQPFHDLFLTDPQTGETVQLTHTEDGIEDFAVSPDGSQIAYAHNDPDGTADIWVLNLSDYAEHPVTNCVDAICHAPAWKPDGTQIAYERVDFADTGDESRPWIVDRASLRTWLLFDDAQFWGSGPVWSPDGKWIAVYSADAPGIRLYDTAGGGILLIGNARDRAGHFSPDGRRLVYPILAQGALGGQFYTQLEIIDLETGSITPVSGSRSDPVEDVDGVWSPDGQQLLVARRYLDARFTPGKQVFLLDLATGGVKPLVVDVNTNHGALGWDSSGRRIVFQRFSLIQPDAQPEVWVYDLETGSLILVAANAFLPQWLSS
jgi:Tol biopolymer transport system component